MKNKLAILALSISIISILAGCGQTETSRTDQYGNETTKTGLLKTGDEKSQNEAGEARSNDAAATTKPTTSNPPPAMNQGPQTAMPLAGETVAILDTDMGVIKFKLFTEQVPEISKNFIELAKDGKYKDTPFHRTVKDFMIQTGDFTNKNGTGGYSYKGPGSKLADEIAPSLKHLYGTVSMANAGPDTNGSQFFIVTSEKGTSFLDGGYSIFGQVYEGMDVAEKIQDLQVPHTEKPSKLVLIKSVKIETIGK